MQIQIPFPGSKKNRNKGQIVIESVLLMVVLLGFFIFMTNYIKEKKFVSNLVKEPMNNLATMAAFGTWKKDGCTSPGGSKQTIGKCHPNSIARGLSSKPTP